MGKQKIIFVHGYTSSSKGDWYPNISKKLDKLGIDYAIPDMPGKLHPHAKDWLEKINKEANKTSKPLILIGHSLGTRAVLLYLEKYGRKVDMVILIAAFANKLENAKRRNENYADFFDHLIDIDKIKSLSKKFIVMHSEDDSSIDYQQGKVIAKDLGAELITYKDRDHFYNPKDYPYVLAVLKKVIK